MHIIRSIAVFLLGAGFAAGAYVSGIAQHLPTYLSEIKHVAWHSVQGADSSSPVVVRVSSSSAQACPSRYRLLNLTQDTVFFAPPPSASGSWRNKIRVPPGTSLGPARSADYRATGGFAPAADGCVPSTIRIELTQR